MLRLSCALLPLAFAAHACAQVTPQSPVPAAAHAPAPTAQPAIDGILKAFETHPVVAIDDAHGLAQQLDFYGALVRDPRFGREVGNVVVEFGGSIRQDIIDRYVAGEEVPYTELRRVWTDTVGWIPVVPYMGQINFFAHVRSANLALPPDQRIRVWLGEPPIDWPKVTTRAEFLPLLRQRDDFPAALIDREILSKNRKALVIYGGGHLFTYPSGDPTARPHASSEQALKQVFADLALDQPTLSKLTPDLLARLERAYGKRASGLKGMIDALGPMKSMRFSEANANSDDVYSITFANGGVRASIGLDDNGKAIRFEADPLTIQMAIETTHPNAVFHVAPYEGFAGKGCIRRFEEQTTGWPVPALATLRGAQLERDLQAPDCGDLPGGIAAKDNPDPRIDLGSLAHDAILYLGPARDLVMSPGQPDMYLDPTYRREMLSRGRVMRGVTAQPEPDMKTITVTPKKWRPN